MRWGGYPVLGQSCRRVPWHVLGEANRQLLRERLGDLQAGDRRSERVLPGYGLTLVTWCDFVIASEQAIFGYPEVRIGTPTIVGAIRLPQRIGWQYAMELLLTGEQITAARAKEIGLAGWVVPHSSLLSAAREFADRLLAAAPLAARATKEVARRAPDMSGVDAIRFGETMRLVANATQDAAEGRAAALEGRPPVWRGQ